MKWGMIVDLSKCMRCHACVAACRLEHFIPLWVNWCRLIAWGSVPNVVEKGIGISYPIGKPTKRKGRIYRWKKDTTRDRN